MNFQPFQAIVTNIAMKIKVITSELKQTMRFIGLKQFATAKD